MRRGHLGSGLVTDSPAAVALGLLVGCHRGFGTHLAPVLPPVSFAPKGRQRQVLAAVQAPFFFVGHVTLLPAGRPARQEANGRVLRPRTTCSWDKARRLPGRSRGTDSPSTSNSRNDRT